MGFQRVSHKGKTQKYGTKRLQKAPGNQGFPRKDQFDFFFKNILNIITLEFSIKYEIL